MGDVWYFVKDYCLFWAGMLEKHGKTLFESILCVCGLSSKVFPDRMVEVRFWFRWGGLHGIRLRRYA